VNVKRHRPNVQLQRGRGDQRGDPLFNSQECRRRAEEADGLAQKATDPVVRTVERTNGRLGELFSVDCVDEPPSASPSPLAGGEAIHLGLPFHSRWPPLFDRIISRRTDNLPYAVVLISDPAAPVPPDTPSSPQVGCGRYPEQSCSAVRPSSRRRVSRGCHLPDGGPPLYSAIRSAWN
jgi:hypothetical protein